MIKIIQNNEKGLIVLQGGKIYATTIEKAPVEVKEYLKEQEKGEAKKPAKKKTTKKQSKKTAKKEDKKEEE